MVQETRKVRPATVVLVIFLINFCCSAQALAGDNLRRGFLFGLGAGVSPISHMQGNVSSGVLQEDNAGIAGSMMLGLGVSDFDTIVLEGNWSSFSTDLYGDESRQIFTGFAWYHYFGPQGRSFFSTLGIGEYEYDWGGSRSYICWGDDCTPPPTLPYGKTTGYLIGGGYEFADHWQVGAFLAADRGIEQAAFSFHHLNILLQYTWY